MPMDAGGFIGGLGAAGDGMRKKLLRAVDKFGEQVIGNAQDLAPVDTGALKASATTRPAVREGTTISKEIGFNTSYAAAVHENLDANFKQGQAKFLETAMRDLAPKFIPYVSKEAGK